jgi:hypothetical protein
MLIINRGESGRESAVTVSSVTLDTFIRGTFSQNLQAEPNRAMCPAYDLFLPRFTIHDVPDIPTFPTCISYAQQWLAPTPSRLSSSTTALPFPLYVPSLSERFTIHSSQLAYSSGMAPALHGTRLRTAGSTVSWSIR